VDGAAGEKLRLAHVPYPVTAPGPGRRIGVWFQGCRVHCRGCMAKDTWDVDDGQTVGFADLMDLFRSFPNPEVTGTTVSGGEPFDQPEALGVLVTWLRESYCRPDQDILLYSGYGKEMLVREHPETISMIDALISEPFVELFATHASLRWRGSSNQLLTVFSTLGRLRYESEVDAPSHGDLQVGVDEDRVSIIGVPRPGDLQRLEDALAERGIRLEEASWR